MAAVRRSPVTSRRTAQRPFFGAADVTCTSGFYDTYFRGDQPLSDDCFQRDQCDAADAHAERAEHHRAELPGPGVRVARRRSSRRGGLPKPPQLRACSTRTFCSRSISFTDQVIGVYPTGYLDAETSVDDYYVEGLIPVLQGKRAVQRLELELGARYSEYEHTDAENTWKALINWQVNDILRFRGGFNRATRAPNLGELFLNPQEIFTGGGAIRRCRAACARTRPTAPAARDPIP